MKLNVVDSFSQEGYDNCICDKSDKIDSRWESVKKELFLYNGTVWITSVVIVFYLSAYKLFILSFILNLLYSLCMLMDYFSAKSQVVVSSRNSSIKKLHDLYDELGEVNLFSFDKKYVTFSAKDKKLQIPISFVDFEVGSGDISSMNAVLKISNTALAVELK